MNRLRKKYNPVIIEEDIVTVDCYRFKMEVTKEGFLRIYAFNSSEKGDVQIIVEGRLSRVLLTQEGRKGEKEVLEVFKINPSKREEEE